MSRSSPARITMMALAVVAAFGAGMLTMAFLERGDRLRASTNADTFDRRDVFSPALRSDPHFLAEQRWNVTSLERHCERTGNFCAEARAARLAFEDMRAGR